LKHNTISNVFAQHNDDFNPPSVQVIAKNVSGYDKKNGRGFFLRQADWYRSVIRLRQQIGSGIFTGAPLSIGP
jgi:hypothetical protein